MAHASSDGMHPDPTPLLPEEIHVSTPGPRRPYRRQQSWSLPPNEYQKIDEEEHFDDQAEEDQEHAEPRGLGLTDVPLHDRTTPEIKRVPVGSRAYSTTTDSPTFGGFSQTTTAQNTSTFENKPGQWPSPQSSRVSLNKDNPYQHSPSNVNLLPHDRLHQGCPTRGDLLKTQWSGFTVMILFLALYSTLFSTVFLIIALAKPRWGHRIGPRGAVSYDSATLLSALLSKMVELSFATTCVVTLGQILTRRAITKSHFSKQNKGISIADMNMRLWIMQPGTLFTHWTGARYAVTSFLGLSALVAAVATVFYTTAAESLVSPKLKFGRNETITMFGDVSVSYANAPYLTSTCSTPIAASVDPANYGISCLQVDLAGNGFRNLDSWLASWHDRVNSNIARPLLANVTRPQPVAVLYENTTVTGQWIYPSNESITADSFKWGRLVQNVTLAMPHANVVRAARSPKNMILQPEDLLGSGEYYLKAAVPAPALNVLCAGLSSDELTPMIRTNGLGSMVPNDTFTTVLDDIFHWSNTPTYTTEQLLGEWYPPWFVKKPIDYNTVANASVKYGGQSVYVLAKSPVGVWPLTSEYILCGIRSFLYVNCSTSYHVASSGGQLAVHCDNDKENWKSYKDVRKPLENDGHEFPNSRSTDWQDVGSQWINAVSLSAGNADSNASVARIMAQTFPAWSNGSNSTLDPVIPTIAEALGVLASYTLIVSSDNSQLVHFWDYARTILEDPASVPFVATLSYKDYASGGDQRWKGVFYLVLFAVVVQNSFCLVYLLINYVRDGELTDYTEPQNLFALAVQSPPSQILAGTCGGGPKGDILGRKFCVNMNLTSLNNDYESSSRGIMNLVHPHFYVRYPEDDVYTSSSSMTESPEIERTYGHARKSSSSMSKHVSWTPLLEMKRRRRMPRPKSMGDIHGLSGGESPAVAQYRRLVQ